MLPEPATAAATTDGLAEACAEVGADIAQFRADLHRALWFCGIGIVTANSIICGGIYAIVALLR